jgi:hypothetical protein
MNKILLFLLSFILLIGFSSALSIGNYGTNQCVSLKQTCDNCTFVNVTSVSAITNTGASVNIIGNVPMTKKGTEYNYTFCSTGYVGEYTYVTVGDPDGVIDTESINFNVGQSSIIFLVIAFVLIYVVGFFGFFGKHIWVSLLGGLAMLGLGIYTIQNGIDVYRNFITNIIAITTIGLGAIFALTSGIEIIQETYN